MLNNYQLTCFDAITQREDLLGKSIRVKKKKISNDFVITVSTFMGLRRTSLYFFCFLYFFIIYWF